jgi:DNA-binding CsgD family transcriptional regulator
MEQALGPAAPLIGRDVGLAALAREWDRAVHGEFRVALVIADAGVGKTRLCGDFLAAHASDAVTMSARAHLLGSTSSFGVWADACEGHLRTLSPEALGSICQGVGDDLAGLLHSVARLRGAVPRRQVPRTHLLESLTVLLANLTAQSPVLVFLDDIHLADDSSWDALHYLARNLIDRPILVLAAARPGELTGRPGPHQILLGLEDDGLVTRIELEPLSTVQTQQLATALLGTEAPPQLVDWLDRRARGNPLFTIGLLRALLEAKADLSAPELSAIPEALAERVAARTGRLDEVSLSVLEVLAVVGRPISLRTVADIVHRPVAEVGAALDLLTRARLVRSEDRGHYTRHEIAHPLVQDAVYQQLGETRRRVHHRAVARGLLAAGRPGEAAAHFVRSAEVGDVEAITALSDAVRQAEAAHQYRDSLELLGGLAPLIPPGDPTWGQLVGDLVLRADWVIDHRADVHAALAIPALRAIDAALGPDADPARRGGVKFRLASFLGWGQGDFAAAQQLLNEAAACHRTAGDRVGEWLVALESDCLAGFGGDPQRWIEGGRRVAAAAAAADEPFVVMQASGRGVGWVGFHLGEFDEAEAALTRSLELARHQRLHYFASLSLGGLAYTAALGGRVLQAPSLLAAAKEADPDWRDTVHLEFEIFVHWLAGRFEAAVEQARESLRWNYRGIARRRALGLVFAGLAAVETDRTVEAQNLLSTVHAAYGGRPWFADDQICRHAQAVLAWREGDRRSAVVEMRAAIEAILHAGARPWAALLLMDLVEVSVELADADQLRWCAERAQELADALDRDLYRALAAFAAAAATGDPAGLTGVAEGLYHDGYPALAGRVRELAGRLLMGTNPAAARAAFTAAIENFESCRSSWRADRARTAARRPGRERASALRGAGALTARERDVALLAARGRSARQIAEELFIGVRTAETHIARVYAKLGVSSQVELVARAGELLADLRSDTDDGSARRL